MHHWSSHVSKSSRGDDAVRRALEVFTSTHILRWLEAMSLLGDTGVARRSLLTAREWAVRTMMIALGYEANFGAS